MLVAAWRDYTKSQCSAGSHRLVSRPNGCDTIEPTTIVQGFACVRTPVQNIRSRDRKRASPMTAFGSEATERLNRRERPVCPKTRRWAAGMAENPVDIADARQTGVFGRYHLDRRKTPSLTPIGDYRVRPSENAFWADANSIGCQKRRR